MPIPLLSIAFMSCAALGLEVLLMRLFAIVQWHHFAYLAVSLALLGYGAAGTALAIFGHRLRGCVPQAFAVSALLFGLSAPAAFLVAQAVPFNALEILWDSRQWLWLALQYLVLLVPFFFAACCLCLVFSHFGSESPRIYSADLWGAAVGAVLALALLFLLPPQRVLLLLAGLALVAAVLPWRRRWVGRLLLAAALMLPWMIPAGWIGLHPSQFKSLSQTLLIPGAHVVAEKHSPLGQVTLVASPQVPFRYAPGLSLAAVREPPPQLGVFVDGEGPAAITRFDGNREPLAFLGQMPSALPYRLRERPDVLVLGAGAGMDVLQALYHGAQTVDAVELDAQLAALVRDTASAFSGGLYRQPRVHLHVADARSFVAGDAGRYGLIVLPLADSFGSASAGVYGMAEDYLHTVEAFRAYFRHLQPAGILACNRWMQLPPRDLIKLAATAVEAMEREGVREPMRHLALLRSWQSATLLVKRTPFTVQEVSAMDDFAQAWAFDLEWAGGRVEGGKPYHRLDRPYFEEAFAALGGAQREDFYRRYKFYIAPADDDRPYFHHFFTWRAMPEIMRLRERGGLPLMEMGYPVLVATWLQALGFGVALILLPLWAVRNRQAQAGGSGRWRVFAYFAVLGMAFMLLEMAFMQKFVLFLGHPLYAAAAVLTAFLLFAGIGSRVSARLGNLNPVRWPAAGIVVWGALILAVLPLLVEHGMGWPFAARLAVAMTLVAPLAFCMGMPFPLGMVRLAADKPEILPWAYGVNACFSVMSAPLAVLLAIEIGFNHVVWLAMGLYVAALVLFPAPGQSRMATWKE